ncbi:MAG: hypothetical protein A2X86_21745 [Bdellovibrionales bacterium GWA2_49_15]|nr:MAG: hypothetical protein A2X86_21745 [Bdellovibrionales bacterium GWA2_49_15]HAZ12838.1 hypothetical protein [Bdellovibrionales bacterium]
MPIVLLIATLLMFLGRSQSLSAEDRGGDEFLTGYIASILERDLHWERGSYSLKIVNRMATITLLNDVAPANQEEADKRLRTIEGLKGITFFVKQGDESTFLGITGNTEAFPTGDLFRPQIADPKWPQFFVTLNRFKSTSGRYTMAAVGFGESFGMLRFLGAREGDGLQLSVAGGIFAQFNMNTPSYNLINADYIIGVPVTYRYGPNSLRFRIYHQSSHLGDEFLQSINPAERVNLSFEALELIYSLEWRGYRVYGGGEYLIHKEPGDLKQKMTHWGVEYYGQRPLMGNGRLVAGVDIKSFEEHSWAQDTSAKIGLEFGHPNPGQRRLRILAEWYKGYDPHGQFYNNKVEYFGMGVSLGF